jgi:hypothetical protein
MLRHIISVSLAMTACATLIPTKANAVTFTLTPLGSLQRNRGDSIDFVLKLNPTSFNGGLNEVQITGISLIFDENELSLVPDRPHEIIEFNRPFTTETAIAYFNFNVERPVKDGQADLTPTVRYRENRGSIIPHTFRGGSSVDVQPVEQPVPEPLTILGAATALGYGAILKRKSSKKTVS